MIGIGAFAARLFIRRGLPFLTIQFTKFVIHKIKQKNNTMNKPDKKLINDLAKSLDDRINFKKVIKKFGIGGVLEAVDGLFFRFALNALVENFWEKIPESLHDEVILVMQAEVSGDWSGVTEISVSALNAVIDIPFADEAEEEELIEGFVKIALAYLRKRAIVNI